MTRDGEYFVEPYGTYLDLIWLNAEVGTGGGEPVAQRAPRAARWICSRVTRNRHAEPMRISRPSSDKLPELNQALNRAELAPLSAAGSN